MYLRYVFLLVASLLASHLVAAQVGSPAAPLVAAGHSLAEQPAAGDTAAAIHRLFAAKRKKNSRFFAGTFVVAAIGGILIATASSDWDGLGQKVLGTTIITAGGLPTLLLETFTALDYNDENERQAIADLQAHKMPRYLKRKLRPKYFR